MNGGDVYTTGQVAAFCRVAPRTVSKWFDSGKLKGYRVPGSRDRRIPHKYLVEFLKQHGMPLGDLDEKFASKVLFLGQDQVVFDNLVRELSNFRCRQVGDGFGAGIQAESFRPDCIVVDFSIGENEALHIYRNVRVAFSEVILIALLPDGESSPAINRTGINETFKKPFDVVLLAERIKTLVDSRARAAKKGGDS